MRKLKLQVQVSVDGFIAGPKGEMDWLVWNWDQSLEKYVTDLTDSIDTILLGRKMTTGFISHWTAAVSDPDHADYDFARKMVDARKVVFTKSLPESTWDNTELAKGDLTDEVSRIKRQAGKDIITYGGATFISSLIAANLIDEYHLFINPAILGEGMAIFRGVEEIHQLTLVKARSFECGITLLHYVPGGE